MSIGCHQNPMGGSQFQIDQVRPAWTATAQNMQLAQGQHRCHIIAFEVIQNDLCNILNDILANRGGMAMGGHINRLHNLCDALFITPAPAQDTVNMQNARTALVNLLNAPAAVGMAIPAERQGFTQAAQNLLTCLNGCPDNLRPGDGGLNTAIGYSIDADFLAGTQWYHGPVFTGGGAPNVGVPPQGAVVAGPGNVVPLPPGTVQAGPFICVRLSPAHEAAVYRYQRISTLALSFVISGIGGAQYPNTANGQHLSSTTLPTAWNNPPYPVLVIDPAGASSPYLYQ